MLIEQLETMQTLLEARQNRRSERNQLQALTTQQDSLNELLMRWQSLSATAAYLSCDTALVERFSTDVNTLRNRFASGTDLSVSSIRGLEETFAHIEYDMRGRWSALKLKMVDESLLARAQIIMVIGEPPVKQRLHRMNQEMREYLAPLLPTAAQYQGLRRLLDEMERSVTASLPAMSDSVRAFLEKLSRNEAQLGDITPEILTWCREQGLTEQISLRFSGGSREF
jgi:hypothetical protein